MKKYLPIILLLVCAAAFAVGVVQLFNLRFEAGDVYPEYSSLRADPLGTMALYESLERVPGVSVRRDHSSANQLPAGRNTTYLHIAAQSEEWDGFPKEIWKEIDGFVIGGGRLAITFYPETGWDFWSSRRSTLTTPIGVTNAAGTNVAGSKVTPTQKRASLRKQLKQQSHEDLDVSVAEHWGIDFDRVSLPKGENDTYLPAPVFNATQLPLPRSLGWHSATIFTNLDKAWKPIYTRGKSPVVIERKFGTGSVVLATDSFFLSNEAMRKERHSDLLSWFVGSNPHIIFDEAHLGIVEEGGVAMLIRQYRLHGLAAALLVLAGLFIWKNSVSLVPPFEVKTAQDYVAGKDAMAGFVNLLRRNIPAREILSVCFNEWTKTLLRGRHYTIRGVDQAQAVFEEENARVATRRDPVGAYRKICEALNRPPITKPPSE